MKELGVDAELDFDRHGGKLISTDLRVFPRADLGRISSCFFSFSAEGAIELPEPFAPLCIPPSAQSGDQAGQEGSDHTHSAAMMGRSQSEPSETR